MESGTTAGADDPVCLGEVFRQEWTSLLRLAFLLSGSHEDAQDAVQSAFLGAQQHWATIDNPEAYLRRAVVNRIKDSQRRAYRRRDRPLAVETVTHQPELDETWHQLTVLSPTQRAVVVLHYYQDLPLVEVGHVLGRPASTVRSDLRRAHHALRKALS